MTTYLIRRFFQTILFILLAWLAVYTLLIYVMPSGMQAEYELYAQAAATQAAQPAPVATPTPDPFGFTPPDPRQEMEGLDRSYGLGRPWPVSFLAWLYDPTDTIEYDENNNPIPKGLDFNLGGWHIAGSGILTGDFGYTHVTNRSSFGQGHTERVTSVLASKWSNTLLLVGLSFFLALLVAVPTGIIAATRKHSFLDHALTFTSFAGFSMPPFMLGTLFVVLLGVLPYQLHQRGLTWLPYLPAAYVADDGQYDNWLNRIYHLVLPVATLALPQIAWLSRQLRFSMLDVMRTDYVRTARAKGLAPFFVIGKHTLRNALLPLITTVALAIPVFISGAIMVETVFGFGGMGQIYYRALGGCLATGSTAEFFCPPDGRLLPLDFPMTLALTLLIIVIVAFANMFADVLYALADPRINYHSKS
jgi:peptide/nickel transport system permease protein